MKNSMSHEVKALNDALFSNCSVSIYSGSTLASILSYHIPGRRPKQQIQVEIARIIIKIVKI
jgi:hypothetical protein